MHKPILNYTFPTNIQNRFGAKRKYDVHTGLDLFCNEGELVYSIYDGIVLKIEKFTGFEESPWWNDTYAVLVYHENINKTIVYGEINPNVNEGDIIKKGDIIGSVLRVLKNDKGLPTTMLHIEAYNGKQYETVFWHHNEKQPIGLENIELILNINE